MDDEVKTCPHCSTDFTGRRSNAVYCSARCQLLAKKRRQYYRLARAAGLPLDHVDRVCYGCEIIFRTVRWNQMYCSPKCKTYVLNGRRIDKQRKTDEEPRVSPALIQRRAAAIRTTWTDRQERRGLTSNVPRCELKLIQ